VLPEGLEVALSRRSWPRDPVFDWLQSTGRIPDAEMYRTFNCGIGMIAVVPSADADRAVALLASLGERAMPIGEVRAGTSGVVIA
jgi:phosphoribosylformylglycinamidine cyclo-ligase